ncbi:MAG: CopG family ribbon-helix-helix protein [Desulfovibrionaceae bacterium]
MHPTPVSIKLEPETKARMKKLAEAKQRSPHWLMREAIRQYLEREERREALRHDAAEAWAEYRRTGLHAPHEEVDAWLAELERGQAAQPPRCRD